MNVNDSIRGDILRALYSVHQKSRSPKAAAILISELTRKLKDSHGYKLQEVASNLDYLVQKGWVTAVNTPRTFRTKAGTMQDSERRTYKISAIGIDKLEESSLYEAPPVKSAVNITNINGVTVVGDGNVVNSGYTELSKALGELRKIVAITSEADDETKLTILSDIDSLSAQIQKPRPDASVISILWRGIQAASTIGGATALLQTASHLLAPLLR